MADKKPEPQPVPEQARKLDYAPEGGRYLVNGKLVDANGKPVAVPESQQAPETPKTGG